MTSFKKINTNAGLLLISLIAILFCFSTKAQIITTVAGDGSQGFAGDGGYAVNAVIKLPVGVAIDNLGNIYFSDASNYRIRKVNTSGKITTIAGTGVMGYSGDGGLATAAKISQVYDVKIDKSSNIYLADEYNNCVRKISPSGIISTIAGNGVSGNSGDNGPATSALLNSPTGLAFDAFNNLYIADYGNQRIRKVDTFGIITNFAGTGAFGFSGDGGPATQAQLQAPIDVAVDGFGNLYISDVNNGRIRMVNSSGIISTFAGNGTPGFSGDGGPAILAQMKFVTGLAFDPTGALYLSDNMNHKIRKIDTQGIITTVAGISSGYNGDGIPATAAELFNPYSVAFDLNGNLYLSDTNNDRVRKITIACTTPTVQIISSKDSICPGESVTLLGVGASTYTWLPGGSTNPLITVSPLSTTIYTLTAATGTCSATDTYTLHVNPFPVGDTLIKTSTPICSGDSIILKATGANSYTWTSISYTVTTADSIINGVKFTPLAGTDTFIVIGKDTVSGCMNRDTISVVVLPSPNIMVTPSSATICPGSSTTFSATGATNYTWTPTTALVLTNDSVATASPTVSTSYVVSGIAPNGCTGENAAIVIIPQDSIVVNSAIICQTSSVTINASSSSGSLTYTWSPSTGLSGTSGSSVVASPHNTTVYTINGTDVFGCMGTSTATVTVDSLPTITTTKTPTISCSGAPTLLTANGASTYTWSTGTVAATTLVYPTTQTEYTVIGTDTNGCKNSATQIVLVNSLPSVSINSGTSSITVELGQSVTLTANGALIYYWNTGNVICDSCASDTVSPITDTQYCVTGTDVNGCKDSTCINVLVEKTCNVFIPDAFSPDGDGQNDVFKVYGNCLTEVTLQIYDRWGNLVFKGSDSSAAWDGSYGGSIMNTGTYVYRVQYTLSTGKKGKEKGNFMLMR